MEIFTLDDFKVFDLSGFHERMAAIISRIRPKLTAIGEELAPKLSLIVDRPLYPHVAKHARRTVNPPDDTWVAFGASPRGYKKDVHFKVSVSRNCVRFLFEAGPEYYAKSDWARGWQREFTNLYRSLKRKPELAWFKNEHDEQPETLLADMNSADVKKVAEELTRRKDGQLVLGQGVPAKEFSRLKASQLEQIALDTFKPLATLFRLNEARVLTV
jgi:uncharacterized protein YktB (UPF0637 family)